MLQDNIKSAVYRSLKRSVHVPYADSNRFADAYGTNRNSKASPMVKKVSNKEQTVHEDPFQSLVCMKKKAKAITSELDSIPSSQLWRLSVQAHKLIHMVDSWPEELHFNQQSRVIANDLLRGASDLQESIIMLERLRQASVFMARVKKEKKSIRREQEIDVEKMGSNRFQYSSYQDTWQAPRVSVDGSSRSRIEELRKVIRDGPYRQNLLSDLQRKENDSSAHCNFNSLSDGDLESSTRSLVFTSRNECGNLYRNQKPTVANSDSAMSLPKEKRPNVIAKLLGLENFPSETVQTTKKLTESKKPLHPNRPNFDIDMPKTGKLQSKNCEVDPKKKTLKEIIDAMQFKGLLKSNSSNDLEIPSHLSDTSQLKRRNSQKKRYEENMPPIVIIKPLHFPVLDREEIEPVKIIQTETVSVSKQMHERSGVDEQRIMENKVLDSKQTDKKSGAEELKINEDMAYKDGVSDSKPILRNLQKNERKIAEFEDETSNKIKAAVVKKSKKEATKACKKGDEVRKALLDKRKSMKENIKSALASRSQPRAASKRLNKPEKVSILAKNRSSCQKSASQNQKSSHPIQSILKSSTTQVARNQKKKEKQDRGSSAINSAIKSTDSNGDEESASMLEIPDTARTSLDDQLPKQTEEYMNMKGSIKTKEDSSQENQNSTPVVATDTSQHGETIEHAEQSYRFEEGKATIRNTINGKIDLKQFFLTSPSFLNSAEGLYVRSTSQPMLLQSGGLVGRTGDGTTVMLDCADELMARRRCQSRQVGHLSPWNHMCGPKVCMSMDQLVEEVAHGIEDLRSYSRTADGVLPSDSLYRKLGKDLRCKNRLINGVWDLGWENGFSVEDVEQVVSEVETHVLSCLIEEAITDESL